MPDEETPNDAPSQTTPLLPNSEPNNTNLRSRTSAYLTSKYGHYTVLSLVALDVTCIFADFIISLHICEHTCHVVPPVVSRSKDSNGDFNEPAWRTVSSALDIVSLIISSLFMVELLASLWAFTPRNYLSSWFHIVDATVIVAGFVIDVMFHGMVEEVGSLVVVGRLWRVVKLVEEFGAAGEEETEGLKERVKELERELEEVKRQRDWWVKGARRGFGLARGHSSSGQGSDGHEGQGLGGGHARENSENSDIAARE